jgi:hypothetical protein
MSRHRSPQLIFAAILIAAPLAASAGGRIMLSQGETTLTRGEEALRSERGVSLLAGDRLSTGANSEPQIWMQDDTVFVLGPQSSMQLQNQSSAGSANPGFALSTGAMRMVTGASRPTVHTAMAKISTIGTDFTAAICTDQCGNNPPGLYVKVDTGEVGARNAHGSVQTGPGLFIFVADAGTAPRLIPPPEGDLPILMARLRFDIEFVGVDLEVVVLPVAPDLPIDPSPSNAP